MAGINLSDLIRPQNSAVPNPYQMFYLKRSIGQDGLLWFSLNPYRGRHSWQLESRCRSDKPSCQCGSGVVWQWREGGQHCHSAASSQHLPNSFSRFPLSSRVAIFRACISTDYFCVNTPLKIRKQIKIEYNHLFK